MKIPLNQVEFQFTDWRCFDDCNTDNETKFQEIIDKLCLTVDYKEVDLKCLSNVRKTNPIEILNLIVAKLCTQIENNPSTNSSSSLDLSKITLCGKDNISYTAVDCLTVLNECFPTLTLEALLQAIIKRINSYSFLISQLRLQIIDLSDKYNTVNAKINQLETRLNNCCP